MSKVPLNEDGTERECASCHKLIYNKKEGCPDNSCPKKRLWWSSSSGRIELQMTVEQAQSVSHSGSCDDDVAALSRKLTAQLDDVNQKVLVDELREYGAWDEKELANHHDNLERLVWIAGCDLAEGV